MRRIFSIVCVLIVTACDGIVTDYHPKRENGPIDGTFGNSRFDSNDVSYTRGNLQYLSDRTSRNNSIYFASVKKYNQVDYQIAKDYIDEYNKFLKVDVEQLDDMLRKDQLNMKSEEIKRKMENGTLRKYPLRNNVQVIQLLKSKKNKIAFPDYMDDYINVYYAYNGVIDNSNDNDTKDNDNFGNDLYLLADKINDRDTYVEFYLGTMNAFSNMAVENYSERSLE